MNKTIVSLGWQISPGGDWADDADGDADYIKFEPCHNSSNWHNASMAYMYIKGKPIENCKTLLQKIKNKYTVRVYVPQSWNIKYEWQRYLLWVTFIN